MTREELALEVESLRFLANEANRRAATAEDQMETMMEQLRELESRIPRTVEPPPPSPEMLVCLARIDQLEASAKKSALISAGGIDMDRLCLFPDAKLPDRFKAPDFAKFDGTGDPKTHLMGYVATMSLHNLGNEVMAQMFHQTLSGTALQWFLSLDAVRKRTWEDIGSAFVAQYDYNCLLKVTMRELEATKMTSKESFSDYVKRWRALASQMIDRPSEKDQIRTITRNLQPTLVPHLIASQASANFQSFFEAGLAVEEGLRDGLFPKLEGQKPKKTPYSGNQAALYGGTAGAGPSGTANPAAEIN